MTDSANDIWIFGYGSLMWRPGFPHVEALSARVLGHSRRFCVASVHHRGCAERPGLVLGLDQGGVCEGIAYRVAAADAESVLRYLREREQVNGVYREARLPIEIEGTTRRTVSGVAYLVERAHPSYAGRLPLRHQARLISGARGLSGVNLDYVINTMRHIAELGIRERELERLMVVIGSFFAREGCQSLVSPRAEVLRRSAARTGPVNLPIKRMRPADRRRFGYRQKISSM